MQTTLFATPAADTAKSSKPARKKAATAQKTSVLPKPEPTERTVLGHFTFETWVSYPARTVNADDGLRVEFTVPVHTVLLPVVGTEKREILCKYRVRRGFTWGQLGRKASVRIDADLCQGKRGGLWLHCQNVDILEGQRLHGEKLSKSLLKKLEKAAQVAATQTVLAV